MKKWMSVCALVCLSGQVAWPQAVAPTPQPLTSAVQTSGTNDQSDLRQQIDQLKKTVAALEARLDAQEKQAAVNPSKTPPLPAGEATVSAAQFNDLSDRMDQAERKSALDRLNWSGDFRFQMYGFSSNYPTHYDGMQMQNLLVRSMFFMQSNGGALPSSVAAIQSNVNAKYGDYLNFTNNLNFNTLKTAMGQFPAAMQQQLMTMLMPSTYVPAYSNNNSVLYTNRLRLNLDAKVSDNIVAEARLTMYKAFGDSTGVQVFDGQPNSIALDGTDSNIPNSDILRVERAFVTWSNIGGLPMYFSVGRRPSTDGPPMNYANDEPRGGTPSGTLIDFQFDGMTLGYHLTDKTTLRACYGVGYEAGYGNGQDLVSPADRLHNAQFFGGNIDIYDNEKTFIQATIARAWNVTDGFNGDIVLGVNPVTGESVNAPVIMRFTPSVNLGGIDLYGLNFSQKTNTWDFYGSINADATRPNGMTGPFGGLMSDPFETPVNHSGWMVLVGARYSLPQNDGKSKFGFEFNHGSKYWFNFDQAEDDLLLPKTSIRGEVYEAYWTQRLTNRFIFKMDYQRFNTVWSGSGWQVGSPKKLDSTPLLGFPTFDMANLVSMGVMARF